MTRQRVWAILMILALVITGCSSRPSTAPKPAESPGTATAPVGPGSTELVMAAAEPLNMDPAIGTNGSSMRAIANAYEALAGYKPGTLELEPVLAESWTMAPDGKSYTFKLRQGVVFHDGTEFDAEAVKFNWDRVKTIGIGAAAWLGGYQSADVVDKHTVRLNLAAPNATFIALATRIFIVSPTAVKANQKDNDLAKAWLTDHTVGTGPYKVEKWTRGSEWVLVRNEKYWRGWNGPHLTKVTVKTVPETPTQRLMLEKGDLDVANQYLIDDLEALSKNQSIKIQEDPSGVVLYVCFVTHKGPMANSKVREALTYIMDYDGFIKSTMKNHAQPARGPVAAMMPMFNQDIKPAKQDLAKAKQLLAEAGYANGLSLRLLNIPQYPERTQAAQILQAEAAKVGVKITIEDVDLSVFYTIVADPQKGPDMYMLGNYPAFPDPDSYLWQFYHSSQIGTNGRNWGFYKSAEFDKAMETGRNNADPKVRAEAYKQAQDILVNKDFLGLWLSQPNNITLTRTWVKGYKVMLHMPEGYWFYDMYLEGKPAK